jgi:luciferase family oxidoreductase group 1
VERNSANNTLRMSILDQSPIAEGSTAGEALWNSIDLAILADGLGYSRYWVAEHHGTPSLACASPEVLIGPIALSTRNIRVGSGGVMLPHYSPLKVAETFGMLSSLFPGRIDLGVGRAAGTSPNIALALQRDRRQRAPDDFREQLEELLRYFEPHAQRSSLLPLFAEPPEPWLLGSSLQSAIWAAELGLPYVFADFINPDGSSITAHYRQRFRPSDQLSQPRVGVAVWVVCAETDDEAEELSLSLRMMMTLLMKGRLIPVPSVARAKQFVKEEAVPLEMLPAGRRIVTGSPSRVRRALEAVSREYGAEEVMIVNIMYDHSARRRSYQLVAGEFALPSVPEAVTT